ncbi:alpha-N-acetylgalactosaminide alpha-2,6-sialyltransferase 1 [Bufo bufo]|uniref:alpha-N-acetylgalactosaminide alpha-2,6-sialyltransferase 1 n=1 Tax=Bufo bufo TaxID=8384 RepID=UPI001ABE4752|nr:alpha-N-acetylgalactosaminide alpha-2,6-sialyltransferase 1 [Bufo bufo]
MKVSRLKILFLILAHIILVILLLVLFANPVSEQQYPKRADESEEHLQNEFNQQFRDYVNPIEDFLMITTETKEEPPDKVLDIQLNKTTEPAKSMITTKKPLNQTQSKSNRTSLDVPSTTLEQTTWKSLKANNFTAEPKWEFEEDYILVTSSHHTTCPLSIKIKAHNVSWLKERFLHDITIFMDARHFNNQEWRRLAHFIPPYGWWELEYPVVKEVMSVLPYVPDQQLLLAESRGKAPGCVTCAVVGNGGILNASRMGKEIDSHDYVFRVNGAMIKGYEADVGMRTSFYGFTAFTMLSSFYLLNRRGFSTVPKDEETKYILFTEGQRDFEWLKAVQQNKELGQGYLRQYRVRPREDFGNNFDFKKLLVVHPDFSRYLKNRFLRSNILNGQWWRIYRPSTGALVLLTALHLCDVVSVYGFMTEDFRDYADHYYDKTHTKVVLYINHDFLLEKDLWARLHEQDIIKLYKGNKGL